MDDEKFAGDLFLTLATEGRLQLDAATADQVIADLQRTLGVIENRLRMLQQYGALDRVDDLPPELVQPVVDAVFTDQLAPGRLELATQELPKYISALRLARRPPVR